MSTKLVRTISSWLYVLAGLLSGMALAQTSAPPAAPNNIFGIRVGERLESQFAECPKNESGQYAFGYHRGTTPCWKADGDHLREVALPLAVIRDTGNIAWDSRARLRVKNGVVVEIEVSADERAARDAERYVLRQYGKPQHTETYERASRVIGLSRHRMHKWQANGVTLIFLEKASSDHAQLRAYDEAWSAEDAKWREELRNRR